MPTKSSLKITYNDFAPAGAELGAEKGIVITGEALRAQAVELAPVKLGELKNSLMYKTSKTDGGFNQGGGDKQATTKLDVKPKPLEGFVGTAVEHGTYQEFGTRYMPAQPFLRPAADLIKGASLTSVVAEFGQKAMEEEFKKRKEKKL
jgi:HK97 gp10 family phage protein